MSPSAFAPLLLLAASSASVIEARLTKVEDITGQPGAPCICDDNGHVLIDGSFRLFFSPVRHITGPRVRTLPPYDQASAQPIEGRKYLLVVAHQPSGDEIVYRGSPVEGLCMTAEEIRAYSLDEVARRLPCKD
jgi:hypothetical protein